MAGAKPPVGWIAVGAGVAMVAAIAGYFGLKPPESPPAEAVAVPAAGIASVPTPGPETAPPPATAVDLRFAIVPSADGIVTIAGTAPPGLAVSIRLDGVELDRVASLGDGSFAAVLDIPPAQMPRVLTVAGILPDGSEIPSTDTGFLPPSPKAVAPQVVAAAEPAAPAAAPAAVPAAAPDPIAPIVLGQSGATVATLQPSDLPPAQVTLDAITYTPENLVQFSGKGQPGAFVRLYLDDNFLTESGVRAEGQWFAESDAIAPGTYTLRIDQVDATGKVASRFETPFLRETQEALALATAPSPTPEEPAAVAAVEPAPEPAPEPGPQPDPVVVAAPPLAKLPPTVIVQPGLTLWAIAKAELGEGVAYVQVFEANRDKIRNPDLIYPGQIFTIPASD